MNTSLEAPLVIFADMWNQSLTTPTGLEMASVDACRFFAKQRGHSGILIRFGITKCETSIMIRKFRRQDQQLRNAGLSRKEIAGVRAAQRRREKEIDTL